MALALAMRSATVMAAPRNCHATAMPGIETHRQAGNNNYLETRTINVMAQHLRRTTINGKWHGKTTIKSQHIAALLKPPKRMTDNHSKLGTTKQRTVRLIARLRYR